MKQKDIALYVVIGIVSAVLSVLVANYLITPNKSKKQKAEVVEKISTEFQAPQQNDKYINANSINPTKIIQIGDDPNASPFKDAAN